MKNKVNLNLEKEIYIVAGFEDEYVSLVISIYQDSQFYIIFNEHNYLELNQKSNELKVLTKKGKILAQLIKKAQKELGIKIKQVSYNLPIQDLKIIPHNYFYQFPAPVLFTPLKLKEINNKFLKNYQKDNDYQNFLFKITEYVLLDQKEILFKPPYNKMVGSIKISGFLYQVKWKQLYQYLQIFKTAGIRQFEPILLPYAIHISLSFLERTPNSILVLWNEEAVQIFAFENKIFSKYLKIEKGIKQLITKIADKFNYDTTDVQNCLYNLFSLDDGNDWDKLELFVSEHEGEVQKVRKEIVQMIGDFVQNTVNEVEFVINEKLLLHKTKKTIFALGKITQISGIENYLQKINPHSLWKIHSNNFIGLQDYNDSFLIGNAYYHHLQKKLLYNSRKDTVNNLKKIESK